MGSQMGYTGRIGNVVHYKMGDKFYSRSLPKKYKQTKRTKAKSAEFGMASTIAKLIRNNLGAVIFNPADRTMQTRLVGEIYTWLQVARRRPASDTTRLTLDRFRFSKSPALSSRWRVYYEVSIPTGGQLQIAIPSFIPKAAFIAPANATGVVCKLASVVIDVENKEKLGNANSEITYTLDQNKVSARDIIQELPMPKGSLLVTGMCLQYFVDRHKNIVQTEDKVFQPSQIIYSVYN